MYDIAQYFGVEARAAAAVAQYDRSGCTPEGRCPTGVMLASSASLPSEDAWPPRRPVPSEVEHFLLGRALALANSAVYALPAGTIARAAREFLDDWDDEILREPLPQALGAARRY